MKESLFLSWNMIQAYKYNFQIVHITYLYNHEKPLDLAN